MGRPINKRYFGSGAGDQIKVRAKIGTALEGDGFIVRQRGTKKFLVTVGSDTGVCTLVDKETGTLGDNEMIVNVRLDNGLEVRAVKLYNRVAILSTGTKDAWNFEGVANDGAAEVLDVEQAAFFEIDFTVDTPVTTDITLGEATVTVTATTDGGGVVSYQWQEEVNGEWVDLAGETTDTLTLTGLTAADDGRLFRARADSTTAPSKFSDATTLDFVS